MGTRNLKPENARKTQKKNTIKKKCEPEEAKMQKVGW